LLHARVRGVLLECSNDCNNAACFGNGNLAVEPVVVGIGSEVPPRCHQRRAASLQNAQPMRTAKIYFFGRPGTRLARDRC